MKLLVFSTLLAVAAAAPLASTDAESELKVEHREISSLPHLVQQQFGSQAFGFLQPHQNFEWSSAGGSHVVTGSAGSSSGAVTYGVDNENKNQIVFGGPVQHFTTGQQAVGVHHFSAPAVSTNFVASGAPAVSSVAVSPAEVSTYQAAHVVAGAPAVATYHASAPASVGVATHGVAHGVATHGVAQGVATHGVAHGVATHGFAHGAAHGVAHGFAPATFGYAAHGVAPAAVGVATHGVATHGVAHGVATHAVAPATVGYAAHGVATHAVAPAAVGVATHAVAHAAPVHYSSQVEVSEPVVTVHQHAVPSTVTYESEHVVDLGTKEIEVPVQTTHVHVPIEKRIQYGVEQYVAGSTTSIHKPKLSAPAIEAPRVFATKNIQAEPEVTVKHSEVTVEEKSPNYVHATYDAGVVVEKAAPATKSHDVPTPVDVPHPVPVAKPYGVPVPTPVKIKSEVNPIVNVDVHHVQTENVITPVEYQAHHHAAPVVHSTASVQATPVVHAAHVVQAPATLNVQAHQVGGAVIAHGGAVAGHGGAVFHAAQNAGGFVGTHAHGAHVVQAPATLNVHSHQVGDSVITHAHGGEVAGHGGAVFHAHNAGGFVGGHAHALGNIQHSHATFNAPGAVVAHGQVSAVAPSAVTYGVHSGVVGGQGFQLTGTGAQQVQGFEITGSGQSGLVGGEGFKITGSGQSGLVGGEGFKITGSGQSGLVGGEGFEITGTGGQQVFTFGSSPAQFSEIKFEAGKEVSHQFNQLPTVTYSGVLKDFEFTQNAPTATVPDSQ